MSGMDDRRAAFENKFAHDQDLQFKVEAKACRLFGLWLAGQIGLSHAEAQAYANEVVGYNLKEPGFDDVLRQVRPNIEARGLALGDDELNARLATFMDEAKALIMQDIKL